MKGRRCSEGPLEETAKTADRLRFQADSVAGKIADLRGEDIVLHPVRQRDGGG